MFALHDIYMASIVAIITLTALIAVQVSHRKAIADSSYSEMSAGLIQNWAILAFIIPTIVAGLWLTAVLPLTGVVVAAAALATAVQYKVQNKTILGALKAARYP